VAVRCPAVLERGARAFYCRPPHGNIFNQGSALKRGALPNPAPAILIGGGVRFSFPSPALSERCHRSLARCRVAMSWRPILTLPEGQCPHPRRTDRRRVNLHDTTDDDALGEHVVIIFVPLAGGRAGRCAFDDEVVLLHPGAVTVVRVAESNAGDGNWF